MLCVCVLGWGSGGEGWGGGGGRERERENRFHSFCFQSFSLCVQVMFPGKVDLDKLQRPAGQNDRYIYLKKY